MLAKLFGLSCSCRIMLLDTNIKYGLYGTNPCSCKGGGPFYRPYFKRNTMNN